jgi:hypothetical protein
LRKCGATARHPKHFLQMHMGCQEFLMKKVTRGRVILPLGGAFLLSLAGTGAAQASPFDGTSAIWFSMSSIANNQSAAGLSGLKMRRAGLPSVAKRSFGVWKRRAY